MLKPTALIVVTLAVVGSFVNQDPAFARTNMSAISIDKVMQIDGLKEKTDASKSSKRKIAVSRNKNTAAVKIRLGTPTGNKTYAKRYILTKYSWGNTQNKCLVKLWTRESNWRHKALNSSSGAYGIPQSLPANKMASAGKDWKTNPATQIKWGTKYIKSRYKTPCGALKHSHKNGWY